MTFTSPIGLIAGLGELPLYFSRQAKKNGISLCIAAIRGVASPKLSTFANEIAWFSVGQLGGLISFFRKRGVRQAVMHGKIQHSQSFRNLKLDWKAFVVWSKLKDRTGQGILKAVAAELSKAGIRLLDERFLMEGLLIEPGWLTRNRADKRDMESIRYGLKCSRLMARLGVGQTVVTKSTAIVAVEAAEGTDEAIRRAGRLAGSGTIVVKVSSPLQDWRFDIPTIGSKTIQNLTKAKASGIVLEAGCFFLLDRAKTIQSADRNGIFILSLGPKRSNPFI